MRFINKIQCPQDLKKLKTTELNALAAEVREFLVSSISKTGGHLSSNLGVVDLTVALHYCLNSPTDKILWDVGHQCYTHKILTGRMEGFKTLRQKGGMSGFIKSSESVHDAFDVGHSSTSLSAAFGMAVSRDLQGESHNIVAVAGDGAITSGLALEALNNIGRSDTNMLVVLNDNQMSISENVGAMSKHLKYLRTTPSYINAKKDVRNILKNTPFVGDFSEKFIHQAKTRLKYLLLSGVLFEELGFKYYGPVDGHNLGKLVDILQNVKRVKGPVLLHVVTQKGKGYGPAEGASFKFHGIAPFDVKTGKTLKVDESQAYTDIFSGKILKLRESNDKIVAITAAMPTGTGLCKFKRRFPKHFFDVGIAESHAVTFAAGLAKTGLRPVVAIYSTFLQRAYDQILHDVCLQNLPVVFVLDRAGAVPADGETHQGAYDISFLSHMPNMTIMSPRNGQELETMLDFAFNHNGPVAIRYPKDVPSNLYGDRCASIDLGRWEVLEEGKGIAILSIGSMIDVASSLREKLVEAGHEPKLINARFAKPIDKDLIATLEGFEYIFTLEENVACGGFGEIIASKVRHFKKPIRLHNFALPDAFLPQGTREEILRDAGLDAESITKKALEMLENGC